MLQIMNPRPLQFPHNDTPNDSNIGIVVNCWENSRPLIKELEQTVNFAERKCGDLMQQLNFCKEYYERWASERFSTTPIRKRRSKMRFCKKVEETRSSSENESERMTTQQMNNQFNEKLRNKIYEITNEIKEANRKIVLRESDFVVTDKRSDEKLPSGKVAREKGTGDMNEGIANNQTESEKGVRESMPNVKRTSSKFFFKKRAPTFNRRHGAIQKYKIRSKSLPQGVRRKFGFGSFVEIVDKQGPKENRDFQKIRSKSRTTVSSDSRSHMGKERMGSRGVTKPKSRHSNKSISKEEPRIASRQAIEKGDNSGDSKSYKSEMQGSKIQNSIDSASQNTRSCSNFSNDFDSGQLKLSSTCLNVSKLSLTSKKTLAVAPRQPIPFTICRTSRTFNLGLNIQQVLSLIKSKRHSTMLQTIIKDNIRTARSVIHKTEPNIKALYIAASSRIGRTSESDVCPARDDGDHCFSVISSSTEGALKCKMLTCRQSLKEESGVENDNFQMPLMRQINLTEIRRPEDVWVVEQPDRSRSLQGFRSRCTCFPTRHSVDYQKVLKQYSRMKESQERNQNFSSNSFNPANFHSGFVMSGTELCHFPTQSRIGYDEKYIGSRFELKKAQDALDCLTRRYESLQMRVTDQNISEFEVDAELDSLESELNCREEDCKIIFSFYNRLIALKDKVKDLRGRVRASASDVNPRQLKSKKDPFRPTPSMTLTRVLRQIQCLQDKIKLIDSPSIT